MIIGWNNQIFALSSHPKKKIMEKGQSIFSRAALLLGSDALVRLANKRVLLVGIGGVGSWCAEGLVRSGIHRLTIVDADRVCMSNVNRQLMATTKTVGQVKVEALKTHLLEINPEADIEALQRTYTDETVASFHLESYDYIIDAIDSLKDKASLILRATATNAVFFSSMGAALKRDATKIQIAEFWKVKGDPLARALRQRFKKTGVFPRRKFSCVFSEERLQNKDKGIEGENANGSLVHVTAVFGFMLAGMVLDDILKESNAE